MSTQENALWQQKLRRTTKIAIVTAALFALTLTISGTFAVRKLSHWLLRFKLSAHKISLEANRGKLTIHQVLDDDPEKISVIVSVTDKKGTAIKNLGESEFKLEQDKVKRKDFTLEPVGNTPISVVLGLDVSASMGRPPRKFAYTKKAAIAFVELAENAHISLVAFGTNVKKVCDYTNDKKQLKEAINGLTTNGTTALFECIEHAGLSMNSRKGRKAIVVLTDGYNTQRGVSKGEAIGTCRGARVPVFCVGLGHEIDRSVLERVATKTGGFFFLAPTPAELQDLYKDIARRLGRQVALVFTSHVVPPSALWLWLALTAVVVIIAILAFFSLFGSFTRPCFVVLSGREEGIRLEFPKRKVFTVGRAQSCSVILRHEDSVAEEHFTLERKEWGIYELTLCKEAKQLFVNGEAVERATLRNGDIVKIGRLRLLLFIYSAEASSQIDKAYESGESVKTEPAWLVPVDEELPTLPLVGKPEYSIGRSRDCDLFLKNSMLAPEQARLFSSEGEWFVENTCTPNLTLVNNEIISAPTVLADGMHVLFAEVDYIFSTKPPTLTSQEVCDDGPGFCTQCGKKLRETSKFCPGCGAEVKK